MSTQIKIKSKVKWFFATAKISFKSGIIFKADSFINIIGNLMSIILSILLWKALYSSNNFQAVDGRSFSDMITYILISRVVSRMTRMDFAEKIEDKVKTGSIGYDFSRPRSTRLYFIAESAGNALYHMILSMTAVLIMSIFYFKQISFPQSGLTWILFFVSIFLGFLISSIFELIKATFSFWFVNVFILNWFLDLFYILLSGANVPTWFFPDWLKVVAQILPFQAAYFYPVDIYLSTAGYGYALKLMLVQVFWICLLLIIQNILWKKAEKKLVILGG